MTKYLIKIKVNRPKKNNSTENSEDKNWGLKDLCKRHMKRKTESQLMIFQENEYLDSLYQDENKLKNSNNCC